MKIFISADIEGVTGITHGDETEKTKPDYSEFQKQMTAEVAAACKGALKAGAKEIYVKDAHDTGRNIIASELPQEAKLIRAWSGHPFSMVQELDDSFDAALMIGYHSRAGSNANPLAHTLTGSYSSIELNGEYLSEFTIHSYAAALVDVPVAFLTGDEGLILDAQKLLPAIAGLSVSKGIGASTISIHPKLAIKLIEEGVESALRKDLSACKLKLPRKFEVKVRFKDQKRAYKASYYPGAVLLEPHLIGFESGDYMDILRSLMFI
ncbi:MAG: amino acid amidase [candidate division Zixibacteria bacterium]|nr:amino acid amidase [candidate division Zixibacteria bacterium]